MPTPNFKLLLQALRLGQPQDPQAAIFALAEAVAAQQDEVVELRRRLSLAQSHSQILEARASRLEADLEALRGGAPSSHLGHAHAAHAPQAVAAHAPQAVAAHAPQAVAAPGSVPPPAPQAAAPTGALPDLAGGRPPFDSYDDFKIETVVVRGEDVRALRANAQAPFAIAPAGQHVPPARGSIPGAPWARSRGVHVPVPADEFTVDAAPGEDGETYQDAGQLAPRDPRAAHGASALDFDSEEPETSSRKR